MGKKLEEEYFYKNNLGEYFYDRCEIVHWISYDVITKHISYESDTIGGLYPTFKSAWSHGSWYETAIYKNKAGAMVGLSIYLEGKKKRDGE